MSTGSATTTNRRSPAPKSAIATRSAASRTRSRWAAPGGGSFGARELLAEQAPASRSLGRYRLSESAAAALSSARVCVGVVEGVQRGPPGNRNAEEAVVALVADVNADVVRTRVPEESDLEAVLLTVGELFEAAVRHGEFLSALGLAIHSPIMRPSVHRSRPGEPHSRPRCFGRGLLIRQARLLRRRRRARPPAVYASSG